MKQSFRYIDGVWEELSEPPLSIELPLIDTDTINDLPVAVPLGNECTFYNAQSPMVLRTTL